MNNELPLTILITNLAMSGFSGTELVVRDLALGLKRLGHYPMIYAPTVGGVSTQIASADIPVVSELSLLPRIPDIIHGHHYLETLQAIVHFPQVPAIFVCHDRVAWHDIPPIHQNILAYVAVDQNCKERLHDEHHISEEKIQVIYNAVDMDRFKIHKPLSFKPQNALIFSNYATKNTHLEPIQKACAKLQLPLDVIGVGVNNSITNPETLIGNYDIIFAKARCAIESIAVGSAVILCDTRGLGEMVTSNNAENYLHWNFGMRLLKNPIKPRRIIKEIKRYNAIDAQKVTQFIRTESSLDKALENYISLYKKILEKKKHIYFDQTPQSILECTSKCINILSALQYKLTHLEGQVKLLKNKPFKTGAAFLKRRILRFFDM